jgi:hypothetical protein
MKSNEARWDRTIRIALGLGLLSLTVVGPESWWGLIGFVPLLTGLAGYCPMYQVCGIDTTPLKADAAVSGRH